MLLFSDEEGDGTGPGDVPYDRSNVDLIGFYARPRGFFDHEFGIDVGAGRSDAEQRFLVTWARQNEETGAVTHGGVRIHFVEKEPIYEMLVEGKDRPTWSSPVLSEIAGGKNPGGSAWLYFRVHPVAGGPFWGDMLFDWQITSQYQWPTGWADADHAAGEAPRVLAFTELPPILAWKDPEGPAQMTADSPGVTSQGALELEGYWREEEGGQVRVTVKVAGVTGDCADWRLTHEHDLSFGMTGGKIGDRVRVLGTLAPGRAHMEGDTMVLQWLGPAPDERAAQERLYLDLICEDQFLDLSREREHEPQSARELLHDRATPMPGLPLMLAAFALAALRRRP